MEPSNENAARVIVETLTELSARIVKVNERVDAHEQALLRQNAINTSTRKCIEGLDAKAGLLFRCVEALVTAIVGDPDGPELSETARREIAELHRLFGSTEEGAGTE